MEIYEIVLLSIGCLLVLLILIVLIRTLTFKPKKININDSIEEVDKLNSPQKLGDILKHQTISYYQNVGTDYKHFQKCINSLKDNYPNVFKKCEFTQAKDYSICFKLKGKSSNKPSVLMAHYDVVPAEGEWDFEPFSGEIKDG